MKRHHFTQNFLIALAGDFFHVFAKKCWRKPKGKVFVLSALLLLGACSFLITEKIETPTDNFSAKLLNVSDGDTITVETANGEKRRVRLFGIDAPELKQAYGIQSRDFLKSIATKNLTLKCQAKRDRYKRFVCDAYTDQNVWLNEELIANGYAWHYTNYSKNKTLSDAEKSARATKKGLWSSPKPIAPWAYRQQNKH